MRKARTELSEACIEKGFVHDGFMGLELGGILLQHASLVRRLKRSNDGSVAPRIFSNGGSGTIGGMQRSTNGFCDLMAISPAVVSFFWFYDVSSKFPPVPLVTCSVSPHEMARDFSLTDEEVLHHWSELPYVVFYI